jgi:TolB-like protein
MLRLKLFGRFALETTDGKAVVLSARKARALLAYLALTPDMSRSRDEIMALLWSDRAESQARGSLRQVLAGLRKELGDATSVLHTNNESVALDPGLIEVTPSDGQELLAGFHLNDAAFEGWLRDTRIEMEDSHDSSGQDAEDFHAEVAVLPFDNMTGDPAQENFADGLTEDLITDLTRFSEFTVYSPWSSFAHDPEKTTEDVAREQEVDYILEGSVRQGGERVRITAMLFDAETVNHVWVERFDRRLLDVLAVQEEVARDVATAIALHIEGDYLDVATSRRPQDRSAMDHVLIGERALYGNWKERSAVDAFEAALVLDPENTRALANLSNWHAWSPWAGFADFDSARTSANSYAQRAMDLNPTDALSLAVLAESSVMTGDHEIARHNIEMAVRQNPNHHGVMAFAACIYAFLGEDDQALRWLSRYQIRDPLWFSAAIETALIVHFFGQRYESAVAAIARWREPPHYMQVLAACAHAMAGNASEAQKLKQTYVAGLPMGQTFEGHFLAPSERFMPTKMLEVVRFSARRAGFYV